MKQSLLLAFTLLFVNLCTWAQGQPAEMADVMRSNGKIYVVVAVILTIFAGIIIYLIRLDRKITKLEKNS
jgi:hypothetical protein